MPAHHVGRDLIAYQIGKYRRMPLACAHPFRNRRAGALTVCGGRQKSGVLRPRQSGQHLEPRRRRGVEEPYRRHGEHAHGVDARGLHQRKVARHDGGFGERGAVAAGRERPVGHALEVMLVRAGAEELAVDADFVRRGRIGHMVERSGSHVRFNPRARRAAGAHARSSAVLTIVSRSDCGRPATEQFRGQRRIGDQRRWVAGAARTPRGAGTLRPLMRSTASMHLAHRAAAAGAEIDRGTRTAATEVAAARAHAHRPGRRRGYSRAPRCRRGSDSRCRRSRSARPAPARPGSPAGSDASPARGFRRFRPSGSAPAALK